MRSKLGKIAIDIVLSIMFLLIASIIINAIAAAIFGKKSNGDADFSGGVLLAITVSITLIFAVWFYKYVHLGKSHTGED